MNKGGESMEAALEMLELLAPFDARRRRKSARPAQRAAGKKGRR
jgi:hypothetical protein